MAIEHLTRNITTVIDFRVLYLVLSAVEAVPAAAFALHVLLRLALIALQAAH